MDFGALKYKKVLCKTFAYRKRKADPSFTLSVETRRIPRPLGWGASLDMNFSMEFFSADGNCKRHKDDGDIYGVDGIEGGAGIGQSEYFG